MKKNKVKKDKWYGNGRTVTNLIIGIIFLIIVVSQSYAQGGESSLALFSSIMNHNSIYLLVLVYFILLKFKVGKRYFNYLNVFLIFVYLLSAATSFLTVVQSFSLTTILQFTLNFVILIYLSHTMFRDTRVWKEFHFNESPFNELSNDWFFYAVIVLSVFLLIVNLIVTTAVSGVILSLFDAVYTILFCRYIYLYWEYLDHHELDSKNEGNFDEVRSKVKVVLDQTEIDDKLVAGVKNAKEKVNKFAEKHEIPEKAKKAKKKIKSEVKEVQEKIQKKSTSKKKGDE